MIALLALSDDGAPACDHDNAATLGVLGSRAFWMRSLTWWRLPSSAGIPD